MAAAHVLERVYILVYKPLHLITGILPFAAQAHIGYAALSFLCIFVGKLEMRFLALWRRIS